MTSKSSNRLHIMLMVTLAVSAGVVMSRPSISEILSENSAQKISGSTEAVPTDKPAVASHPIASPRGPAPAKSNPIAPVQTPASVAPNTTATNNKTVSIVSGQRLRAGDKLKISFFEMLDVARGTDSGEKNDVLRTFYQRIDTGPMTAAWPRCPILSHIAEFAPSESPWGRLVETAALSPFWASLESFVWRTLRG